MFGASEPKICNEETQPQNNYPQKSVQSFSVSEVYADTEKKIKIPPSTLLRQKRFCDEIDGYFLCPKDSIHERYWTRILRYNKLLKNIRIYLRKASLFDYV